MISKENKLSANAHKKHTDLIRPSFGTFNRNEWAIIGGPCTAVKLLADQVIKVLSAGYKCGYVDTTHNDDVTSVPGRLPSGSALDYTDMVNYRQLNYVEDFNSFKLREIFAGLDLVLVNGNHQQAKAQVVIINKNKMNSLHKRIGHLSNVQMILLADDTDEVFDFVKGAVPEWQSLPLYRLDETEKIIAFFKNRMQQAQPVLNGLVLAGGKSQRMGFDKAAVNWHGKEQRYHLTEMLKPFCDDVYISCRADQQSKLNTGYVGLPDTFTGLGPFGAILSAFREKPDNAWFVVACDLPLLDENTLKYLVNNRNSSSIGTAYQSSFQNFPEPLITIWEPKSYPVLLSFLAQGYSCPRKVLINSNVTVINAPDPKALTNVNTPDELDQIKRTIHQKIAVE